MSRSTHFSEAVTPLSEAFRGRSFLSTADFTSSELADLLDLAVQQKGNLIELGEPLKGKSVALVFFNPSLRTRTSMVVAVQQLGGVPVVLDVGQGSWSLEYRDGVVMDGDKAEHIKEAAPVLSRYVQAVGVRCFPHMENYEEDRAELVLRAFEKHARIPVINMESSTHHPLQGLADVMTIKERFGTVNERRVVLAWAYHPKPLPMSVPNTFALVAAQFGMHLTIASPPGYELDEELMNQVHQQARQTQGSVRIEHDLNRACRGAEVVYAKSWGSLKFYGRWEEEARWRSQFKDWQITESVMQNTKNGVFMHCLPVRRNVVVADEVLDGPRSIVIDQVANRLYIQKTLLSLILG